MSRAWSAVPSVNSGVRAGGVAYSIEPQSTARPVVVNEGSVIPAAWAQALTMSGQSWETVNTVAVNWPSIGGAGSTGSVRLAGFAVTVTNMGMATLPTWPMTAMSPAASRMSSMADSVSSFAAAPTNASP